MKKVLGTLCILLLCTPCFAENEKRAYVFIGPGITFAEKEIDISSYSGNSLTYLVQTETDGLLILGGGGYKISRYLRIEGELGYRTNKINNIKVKEVRLGVDIMGGNGDISSFSIMSNVWYDLNIIKKVKGYFCLGIGAAQIMLKDIKLKSRVVYPSSPIVERLIIDDKVWEFAYQLGIGFSYELFDHVMIDLGYRYFATNDPVFVRIDNERFKTEYRNNNILVLVKYFF